MADEETGEQANEVEQKARKMGWRPQEEYRGEAPWIDAETFVKRGEEVLPIVQSSNRRLREQLEAQNARVLELERTNKANAMALEQLQEANREQSVQTTQQTVEQLTEAIVAAHDAGDLREELRLRDLRDEAKSAAAAVKVKPAVTANGVHNQPPPQDVTQSPEFQQFLKDNPWWQSDAVMRAASIEIQNQLYASGEVTAAMQMAERLEVVAEATRKRFGMKDNGRRSAASRVEGGGGPGTGRGGGSGKTYNDLPSEAKDACNRAAKRLTFGSGKKFKDENAWRAHYVETYFS